MMDSDEAIERVLAGLRDAEAPADMERRILETVRKSTSSRSGWRLAKMPRLVEMRISAIAVAGLIVVSSIVCWTALKEHRPEEDRMGSKSQTVSANLLEPEAQVGAGRTKKTLAEKPVARWRAKTNARKMRGGRKDESANALNGMSAANHPAPEPPLTKEEKLLLRIAHRGDPTEMAALNPLLWAARDAEEKAEVRRFFESTTGDDK